MNLWYSALLLHRLRFYFNVKHVTLRDGSLPEISGIPVFTQTVRTIPEIQKFPDILPFPTCRCCLQTYLFAHIRYYPISIASRFIIMV